MEYIIYTHADSEITSITEFLDQSGLSVVKGMTSIELLSYTDNQNISNFTRLWGAYNTELKQQYQSQYLSGTLTYLPLGATLALPKNRLFREVAAITGSNQLINSDYNAFWHKKYAELLTNSSYSVTPSVGSHIRQQSYDIGVWMWSRALWVRSGWHDILNLSQFVESCTLNVDGNGGNWTITMCAVDVSIDGPRVELINTKDNISKFTIDRDHHIRLSLHEKLINTNDVIWISLERLILESPDRKDLYNQFLISPSELGTSPSKTRVYDMIGLVDSVSVRVDDGEITVTITGKDLSKLLIDDGAFAYPLQFAQRAFIQPNNRIIQRLAATGSYILQSALAFRSIRFSLQYIFNHLVNLGVVPNDLLSGYRDRVEVLRIGEEQDVTSSRDRQLQVLDNELTSALRDYGVTSTNIPLAKQQLIAIFTNAKTQDTASLEANGLGIFTRSTGGVISGYRDWNFAGVPIAANTTPPSLRTLGVFLFNSTPEVSVNLGNPINFASNTIPNRIFSTTYAYVNTAQSSATSDIEETLAQGLWQIAQLVVDPNIADRRIADPSISHPDGSLLSHLWKICQDPFVQLLFDTYGDRYAIIARQPPFTQQAITNLLTDRVNSEDGLLAGDDVIIDIPSDALFNVNLEFSDEVYTMYELSPQGAFLGQGSEVSLAYVPIIVFPQYADIWGVKRKQIVSNYISYQGITKQGEGKNYIAQQIGNDLQFVLETTCLLPFTRRGSLSFRGDRRIKVGTWVRIESTGEIAYVDSVNQQRTISNGSIEATTNIQVSRAMIEKYVTGVNVDGVKISYFNIVDSQEIKRYIVDTLTNGFVRPGVQLERSFGVNQKVFDFFISKQQLE